MTAGDRPRGTVWIAWDEKRYIGYWDLEPDGPRSPLEQMPEYQTTRDAIAWGQARARRVLIRPESDSARYYWAGGGEPPDDLAALPKFEPV